MAKARPNDRCPCGSGAKFKKCCGSGRPRAASYTSEDRSAALAKLEAFFRDEVVQEHRDALADEFWEGMPSEDEDPELMAMSAFAFEMYCLFDVRLDGEQTVADLTLEAEGLLSPGERAFVEVGRRVGMRLYEVTAVTPGQTMTLRDCVDGSVTTVRERAGSMSVVRWDLIATRVFPVGASGMPELDGGILGIRRQYKEQLLDLMAGAQGGLDPEESSVTPREALAILLHDFWRLTVAPPQLVEDDGNELGPAVISSLAGGSRTGAAPIPSAEVAAQIEAMLKAHHERWLDEPVPMFDGLTPRQAGASDALRPRVREAMKDLERDYQRAQREGQPAFRGKRRSPSCFGAPR